MATNEEKQELNKHEETPQENESSLDIDANSKKRNKTLLIKRVLIGLIAVLAIFLIIIILVFIFKNDSNEESSTQTTQNEQNIESTSIETVEQEEADNKDFKFDFNNLEPEKLNEQLALLTNKHLEIQTTEDLNKQKQETFGSLSLENGLDLNKSIDTTSEILEDPIVDNAQEEIQNISNIEPQDKVITSLENNLSPDKIYEPKKEVLTPQIENINNGSFVKLINIAKIKGELQKKYLDKVVAINPDVLLCRDDENIIELYYGPFSNDNTRNNLFNKLSNSGFKESYLLEMAKDEFEKRCKY